MLREMCVRERVIKERVTYVSATVQQQSVQAHRKGVTERKRHIRHMKPSKKAHLEIPFYPTSKAIVSRQEPRGPEAVVLPVPLP